MEKHPELGHNLIESIENTAKMWDPSILEKRVKTSKLTEKAEKACGNCKYFNKGYCNRYYMTMGSNSIPTRNCFESGGCNYDFKLDGNGNTTLIKGWVSNADPVLFNEVSASAIHKLIIEYIKLYQHDPDEIQMHPTLYSLLPVEWDDRTHGRGYFGDNRIVICGIPIVASSPVGENTVDLVNFTSKQRLTAKMATDYNTINDKPEAEKIAAYKTEIEDLREQIRNFTLRY